MWDLDASLLYKCNIEEIGLGECKINIIESIY